MYDYYYSLLAFFSAIVVIVTVLHNNNNNTEIKKAETAYRHLAIWVVFFCLQDAVWGIAFSSLVSNQAFLFITSSIFHISATITAFFWTRYVTSYLEELKIRKIILLALSIGVIVAEAALLIINYFHPTIFYVDKNAIYHTASLRSWSFCLQYMIYLIIGVIALFSWIRQKGATSKKHLVILSFIAAPCVFGFLQALFPDGPFYSVGFSIGCIINYTFIVSAEQKELMHIREKDLKNIIDKQTLDLRHAIENEAKQKKQLAERIETLSEQYNIISALSSEMMDVSIINLKDNSAIQFKANGHVLEKDKQTARPYYETWLNFINHFVIEEDCEETLKNCDIKNVQYELSQKPEYAYQFRIQTSTGLHYVLAKFLRLYNDNTEILMGLSNIDTQICFEKKRNETLRRNFEIIEILASEYSSVYYIELGCDKLIPFTMNKSTEKTFGSIFRSGITYSEAYKLYVEKMVHLDDSSKMQKAGSIDNITTELSNKKAFITLYKNNEGRFCEMKFVKVGNSADTPTAVALGFADKDDEIRAEKERNSIALRNMAVISGLSDDFGCVIYVDSDTEKEYHYRFDQTFEKTIPGWTEIDNFNERLNVFTEKLVHPDDKKAFIEATRKDNVLKEIENGEPFYVNFRIVIDSKVMYYQAKFIRAEISHRHVIVGFHNVDDETRRKMDAVEKANAASIAKTEFLFNMSHDIRTPMNAILGYISIANKHKDDTQKVADCNRKIEIAANNLLELINQILEMSRIETGHCELFEGEFNIAKKADEVSSIFDSVAISKNITLKTDLSGIQHNMVYSDAVRITQIISNVLGNAFKYTPTNGTVTLSVKEEICDKQNTSNYIISIKDNGIGMSKEYLEQIFENFSRENNSTTSGVQGTGLGMSIVKRLIDLFGGTISIQSEQGKGTEMIISLPLKYIEKDLGSIDNDNAIIYSNLCGIKILLVDDNEMNREIGTLLLEEYGANVKCVEDGNAALETIRNSAPGDFDLVLMDVQMPRMNGYDATKAIRSIDDKSLSDIPIIAMTANAFKEDRDMALQSGMNAHISKPIDIESVTKVIKGIIKK